MSSNWIRIGDCLFRRHELVSIVRNGDIEMIVLIRTPRGHPDQEHVLVFDDEERLLQELERLTKALGIA